MRRIALVELNLMGKLRFARKEPVGFKRLKSHKESGTRKNKRTKDDMKHRPSSSVSVSGDSSEEHSNVASEEEAAEEEEIAYKEPSMYDNLLKTLSGSESFAKAYKKRQREEEGKSDSEEDLGSGLESFSVSEEEDDSDEGTDKESPRSLDMNSNPRGSDLVGEHSESIGDEDEGSSESDEAHDFEVNGQSALEASVSMRFCNHLLHLTVFCNWRCIWVIILLFDQLRDSNPLTFPAILT